MLLDDFIAITGYHRRYARWLLNHAEAVLQAAACPHRRYGPEVQRALVLAWNAANRICAKRLIPVRPMLIDSLERHGHLRLTEESHRHLLSMSASIADRLLHVHRQRSRRGLSTTQAGTLLKSQIPIRTFREWDEVQLGFLEADLMAHCGTHTEGSYLSTLTLTDHRNRLDRMPSTAAERPGRGAGRLAARPHPLPLSHAGPGHG
ncbi:MAG: hypothetical protein J2P36_11905 [Ktedonobacteraceae bacterium]|nr:hypothetical protein [Ktedonobacteraceae bacterium]